MSRPKPAACEHALACRASICKPGRSLGGYDPVPVIDPRNITLAVLAGGEGRRMGKPKAELLLGGIPILQYLLARWRWPGPTLLVTAPGRQHPPGHEGFDAEAIDPVAGLGPLCGLLTALETCQTSLILATTVDMPAVGTAQFAWLAERLAQRTQSAGLMIARRAEPEDRIEPFPSAFRAAMSIEPVRRRLDGDDRSIHGLASLPEISVVRAPDDWPDDVWTNLNRPEDVRSFAKKGNRA